MMMMIAAAERKPANQRTNNNLANKATKVMEKHSSDETVIARLVDEDDHNQDGHCGGNNDNHLQNDSKSTYPEDNKAHDGPDLNHLDTNKIIDDDNNNKSSNIRSSVKNLLHFAGHHLNIFHHHHHHHHHHDKSTSKSDSNSGKTARLDLLADEMMAEHRDERQATKQSGADIIVDVSSMTPTKNGQSFISGWARRYLRLGANVNGHKGLSKSAPTTPIKSSNNNNNNNNNIKANGDTSWQIQRASEGTQTNELPQSASQPDNNNNNNNDVLAHSDDCPRHPNRHSNQQNIQQQRPSVRFVESTGDKHDKSDSLKTSQPSTGRKRPGWGKLQRQSREQVKFADCAVQTSGEFESYEDKLAKMRRDDDDDEDEDSYEREADDPNGKQADIDDEGARLVARLFQLPGDQKEGCPPIQETGESPMNSEKFRDYGYKLIDYISNYLDTIGKRRVTPLNIEPGYLKTLIQPDAPEKGESFATIMRDFENHIMCGITHWQHPHFHAYFPAGNAYPSILADMLSDALGCVGFSWAASPAYTELEIIMLDWMGKMIGLPEEFLCLSGVKNESKGGGVIQGSASECVLVNLLAARHWAMEKLRQRHPGTPDGILLSRLIGYCSKEAHSCVEKASMIGFIRMRALETDENHSLRGETLAKAIEADKAQGLEPFIVCATLGTTSCVSFDNLKELGQVCRQNDDIWLHVDAAYAGSALICPEFKYLMEGIEMATSFNMNPNKWMLINFDCSLMWVKDRFKLTRAFVVDPLYLQHSFSDQAIDYRHWGIPLSRRFRALKLWFVIRNYGVEGLRAYIRNHVRLAKLFEQLIREDKRFMVTNEVVLGLVCFRLVGSNALNQRLLSMINASGKLHMVPASVNGRYVIRFCVCDQNAKEADILYAYDCISEFATELFESIRAGKERIRAISQQNTIDVSSISLHTQQSASADRLNSSANSGLVGQDQQQPVGADGATKQARSVSRQQSLSMRRNSRHEPAPMGLRTPTTDSDVEMLPPVSPTSNIRSPLVKQASIAHAQHRPGSSSEKTGVPTNVDPDDLEQEVPIDSLDSIHGYDYDLDDEDLNEVEDIDEDDLNVGPYQPCERGESSAASTLNGPPVGQAGGQAISPMHSRHGRLSRGGRASRTFADGNDEQEEAADEVFKLTDKRHRMSVRYKREFFVRVVSDPRVYRASISGDINAHASTCSLGPSAGVNSTQQARPNQTTSVPDEANNASTTATGAANNNNNNNDNKPDELVN